jgi:hypothetical protein
MGTMGNRMCNHYRILGSFQQCVIETLQTLMWAVLR